MQTYPAFDGTASLVELGSDMAHDGLFRNCVGSHGGLEPNMWIFLDKSLEE